MARSKPSKPNKQKYSKQFDREVQRLERIVKEAERRGMVFSVSPVPQKPTNVMRKDVEEIRQIKPADITKLGVAGKKYVLSSQVKQASKAVKKFVKRKESYSEGSADVNLKYIEDRVKEAKSKKKEIDAKAKKAQEELDRAREMMEKIKANSMLSNVEVENAKNIYQSIEDDVAELFGTYIQNFNDAYNTLIISISKAFGINREYEAYSKTEANLIFSKLYKYLTEMQKPEISSKILESFNKHFGDSDWPDSFYRSISPYIDQIDDFNTFSQILSGRMEKDSDVLNKIEGVSNEFQALADLVDTKIKDAMQDAASLIATHTKYEKALEERENAQKQLDELSNTLKQKEEEFIKAQKEADADKAREKIDVVNEWIAFIREQLTEAGTNSEIVALLMREINVAITGMDFNTLAENVKKYANWNEDFFQLTRGYWLQQMEDNESLSQAEEIIRKIYHTIYGDWNRVPERLMREYKSIVKRIDQAELGKRIADRNRIEAKKRRDAKNAALAIGKI